MTESQHDVKSAETPSPAHKSGHSESGHTDGPWTAVPQSDGSAMIAHEYETGNQMRPKGLRLVCHVLTRGNSLKQDEANARLIAAAPELYALLVELTDIEGPLPGTQMWARKVAAALSRARGESQKV